VVGPQLDERSECTVAKFADDANIGGKASGEDDDIESTEW